MFQNGYIFLFPHASCWKHKEFSSLWEYSESESHENMGCLLGLGHLGDLNSKACLHWASSNLSITVQLFLLWYRLLWPFLLLGYSYVFWFSASTCFVSPNFWYSHLPCDHNSQMYLRTVVDFQFIQSFTREGSSAYKLLRCCKGNQKSPRSFLSSRQHMEPKQSTFFFKH